MIELKQIEVWGILASREATLCCMGEVQIATLRTTKYQGETDADTVWTMNVYGGTTGILLKGEDTTRPATQEESKTLYRIITGQYDYPGPITLGDDSCSCVEIVVRF